MMINAQVADTHLNCPLKRGIKSRFNQWTLQLLMKDIENSDKININLKLSTLKPLVIRVL